VWAVSFRAKIFLFGASIACLGTYALVSGAHHYLTGVRATATFVTYADECTVELQGVGESHTRKTMSCDEAEHMQRVLGSRKAELTRVPGVNFRFTLASGEVRELVRSRTVLGNPNMDSGDKFAVIYDPSNPDDVRIIPSPIQILLCFGGIPAGLCIMLMALGIHPASAMRRLGQAIGGAAQTQTLPLSAPVTYADVPPPSLQNLGSATTRENPSTPRTGFGKRAEPRGGFDRSTMS
jgi:Protein of unknown function (DUF3592)